MTKPGKTPKKKTKEKSPQRTEESEYPAMDEDADKTDISRASDGRSRPGGVERETY